MFFEYNYNCNVMCHIMTYLAQCEGVWAQHTTVIRAADQREVGSVVRKLCRRNRPDADVFVLALRLQIYWNTAPRTVFHEKLDKACSHCRGATVLEMVASETQESCRSTFVENVCFGPHVSADLLDFVFRCCLSPTECSIAFTCMSLSRFTGMHCSDIDRSGISLATASLTGSAPMQRGARPLR